MRHISISALDISGKFLAFYGPSRAATEAGINDQNIIGRTAWEFVGDAHFKSNFADCIIHGEPRTVRNISSVQGRVEQWRTILLPARGTEVIAISHEVHDEPEVDLAEDDREILRQLADDKTVEEVAAAANLPRSTVSGKLKRIREKCGVKTNHGLVAWLVRNGLI